MYSLSKVSQRCSQIIRAIGSVAGNVSLKFQEHSEKWWWVACTKNCSKRNNQKLHKNCCKDNSGIGMIQNLVKCSVNVIDILENIFPQPGQLQSPNPCQVSHQSIGIIDWEHSSSQPMVPGFRIRSLAAPTSSSEIVEDGSMHSHPFIFQTAHMSAARWRPTINCHTNSRKAIWKLCAFPIANLLARTSSATLSSLGWLSYRLCWLTNSKEH